MRWGWCVGCVEGDLSDGEVWKSAESVISDTKKGDRLLEGYQLTTYQVSGGVITSLDPFLQARPKCFASSLMLVECNGNSPAVSGHTIDYKEGPCSLLRLKVSLIRSQELRMEGEFWVS